MSVKYKQKANPGLENIIIEVAPLLKLHGEDLPEKVRILAYEVARFSWKTAVSMIENSPFIIERVGYDGLE